MRAPSPGVNSPPCNSVPKYRACGSPITARPSPLASSPALRGRRDEANAVEVRVAGGQLVSEQMRHTADRARLAGRAVGLRDLVCPGKDASDELVDRLWTALGERIIPVTADGAAAVGAGR
jgi:hypothetical protein